VAGLVPKDAGQSRVSTIASAASVLRKRSANRRLSLSLVARIAFDCLRLHTRPALKIGASGMKQVVIFEILFGNKLIDEPKTLLRTVDHGDSNRPVQQNNGGWLRLCQCIIQLYDLPPICVFRVQCTAMHRAIADCTA
jgi:hypothetical protein